MKPRYLFLGVTLLAISSPCLATQSSEDPVWKTYGETAEGDLIELYTSSPQRESGKNIVYFTYRLTEKNGMVKVLKARSTDCFKGARSSELNGRPRNWAIRTDGQWKVVRITSDATINLLINACRASAGAVDTTDRGDYYPPETGNPNSLGYIVSDADYYEILATACTDLRNGHTFLDIRAGIWVGLASRSNVTYDRTRLERETANIAGIAARTCY
jgi:hypothetical protein